jgi:hypothetical protein
MFENRVLREHLSLRGMKKQEAAENCMMRSFITCTPVQTSKGPVTVKQNEIG